MFKVAILQNEYSRGFSRTCPYLGNQHSGMAEITIPVLIIEIYIVRCKSIIRRSQVMTKYREILRLTALGLSQRNIIQSIGVSQKTIVKVQRRALELHISWPLDESLTDVALEKLMFPKEPKTCSNKRMPDFNYIQKELLRNGVNKKLLWTEHLEECRQSDDKPLMYSQFCYYIQQDEQKRRATMHINWKPGEQIEVDWAGDPAQITDPETGEIIPAFLFVGVMTYSQYPYVEALSMRSSVHGSPPMYTCMSISAV